MPSCGRRRSGSVASDLQPVAVVFDLVDPAGAGGDLVSAGGDAGRDVPVRAKGMCQNIGLPSRSATGQITAGWDWLL
jgi:hypothetical protein